MNYRFIFIPGLFALGFLAGIAMMSIRTPDEAANAAIESETAPAPDTDPSPNPFASMQTKVSSDPLIEFQNQLDRLSLRIEQLEQRVATVTIAPESSEETVTQARPANDTQASAGFKRTLTAENLIKAGIGSERADDILRRKSDIELKKLELRDRATREQYLGTSRYNHELNELTAGDVPLREELGDEAYDRYLYASGQTNRVLVSSVMTGSQAEFAGMQSGDVILSYDDQNLFEWSELQQATTQGERGEYVNVNVLRDGQMLNLWIPRGPLGVRLGATRREP